MRLCGMKSRMALIRRVLILRLKLLVALITARMLAYVENSEKSRCQQLIEPIIWRYNPIENNLAYKLSKGFSLKKLNESQR
ncbi:hypothetical protein T11_3854 [Trichinella zimbabwensis]|uniref:Uncharacterized protein n=1 Tax=Trichinella zimbabwensis TaxID=268475 RepID=A0A0V1HCE0_9BILA|nr:hypothetical protein T11_3854 [Trichinella zimbabwensis]